VINNISNNLKISKYNGPHYEELCVRIAASDDSASTELYNLIGRAIRVRVRREFPDDVEDIHHDVFMVILLAIQSGNVRNSGSILSYALTLILRRRSQLIKNKIVARQMDPEDKPECAGTDAGAGVVLERNERWKQFRKGFQQLPDLKREIVERFYFKEEPKEQIMAEMNLTYTQFRLQKSRAIGRWAIYMERLSENKRSSRTAKAR
jgi:DNA-directed RNA polymerase specialized sigma24 family protein